MNGDEPADGGESELTLLRVKNEQLEARLREAQESSNKRLVALELKSEAIKSGMVDLDGLKMLSADDVSVDEHGQVRGASVAMARMRRDKPWLFATASSSSMAGVPAQVASRAKLATEMTLDEWRTARAELLRRR
jgi:hypothetical protein